MRVGQTRRRDAAEPAIVRALRAVGCEVWHISGKGLPDLLVRRAGVFYACEVKTGKGRRTQAQETSQFPIVRTPEEAIRLVTDTSVERLESLMAALQSLESRWRQEATTGHPSSAEDAVALDSVAECAAELAAVVSSAKMKATP